jgi:hypothetical protein
MMKIGLAIVESDFLRLFIENLDEDDWPETARSWLIAAIVVAVLCTGLMIFIKWFKKQNAGNVKGMVWSKRETLMLMLIGLLPVFIAVFVVWYASRDFFNIVGVGGLLRGVFFSWLLYLILFLLGHLLSPWRRELL